MVYINLSKSLFFKEKNLKYFIQKSKKLFEAIKNIEYFVYHVLAFFWLSIFWNHYIYELVDKIIKKNDFDVY